VVVLASAVGRRPLRPPRIPSRCAPGSTPRSRRQCDARRTSDPGYVSGPMRFPADAHLQDQARADRAWALADQPPGE
jgi:hypothetical protein